MCNMSVCTYFHIVEDGLLDLLPLQCQKRILLVFPKTISQQRKKEKMKVDKKETERFVSYFISVKWR